MGIDLQPNVGTPGSFNAVIHHTPSALFDIKAERTITWNVASSGKKDPRYCGSAGSQVDEDELSFGVLQIYSSNGNAGAAALGVLWMNLTVEFSGPC